MKSTQSNLGGIIGKLVLVSLLFFAFSCAPETSELELSTESMKSRKAVKAKVIAKGAAIRGTNGMYFSPDDELYIASFYGQEIVVMNRQNGKILRKFGVDNGVLGPDDLVFHPNGESFYFTDILTGFVGRMDLQGNLMGYQFVAPGVNPVTFSDDGRLFVALDFQGDGLYELDPNLVNAPTPIVPYVANTFPLGFLNAFDFGPDGRLYGPSFLFKQIISVDVDGGPTSEPYVDGTAIVVNNDADWEYPVAAKFGPDGLLTVLDQSGKIWKLNHETGTKTLFTTLEPGLDNLAFDSDGKLYVSNADFGWVIQILPSGQARTISNGGMIGPQGLAVLPGRNNKDEVFVGDLFRMRKFNGRTGKEEEVFKGYLVPEPDKLTMPFSVQADGENLIVSSWFSGFVQVWSPDTDEVVNNQQFQMETPIDAVRVNGEIYVSDLKLTQPGVYRASDDNLITGLAVASGLATDGVTLWAADWFLGTITQIDFDGNTPISTNVVATGLLNPEGLAFEKPGYLVVVETGASRLSRVNLATGEVTTVVEDLELSGASLPGSVPTWWFDGVGVGPSGSIYVNGGGTNVLYRVSKE